jgi:hypothetical protein
MGRYIHQERGKSGKGDGGVFDAGSLVVPLKLTGARAGNGWSLFVADHRLRMRSTRKVRAHG